MSKEALFLFKAAVGNDPDAAFELASQMFEVPHDLARAVEKYESGGNQSAISPKKAIGRMQLMEDTAKGLGVNPHDEIENIFGGVKYLGEQYKKFGSPELAVAAYNAGPGAVEKHGGIPPYKETQGFVSRVMNFLGPSSAEAATGEDEVARLAKIAGIDTSTLTKTEPAVQDTEAIRLAKIAGVDPAQLVKETPVAEPSELRGYKTLRETPLPKIPTQEEEIAALKQEALNYPEKLTKGIQGVVNIPSDVAYKLFGYKIADFLQSQSLNPEETKGASEMLARGIGDIPAYSTTAKLAGTLGLLTRPPGTTFMSKTIEPMEGASEAVTKLTEQIGKTEGLEKHLKGTIWDTTSDIQKLQGQLESSGVWAEAAGLPRKGAALLPEQQSHLATLQGLRKAQVSHLDRVQAELGDARAVKAAMEQQATPKVVMEEVPLKYMYGGGPDTDAILSAMASDIAKGTPATAALKNVADALKVSPSTIAETVRNASQTSAGALGSRASERVYNAAQVIDSGYKGFADETKVTAAEFKQNLPSLRDVGLDVPPVPKHPGGVDPNGNIFPKADTATPVAQTLSPSIVSGNLFGKNGPIHEWMGSWHKNLFEQAYYRKFLNNVFKDAGLMDDVKASEKAAEATIGPLSRELEKITQGFSTAQSLLEQQKRLLSKMDTGSPAAQAVMDKIKELESIKMPNDLVKQIYMKLDAAIKDLELAHPNIRIKRAADGNKDSWGLLNPKEQEVATKLQDMYKQFGVRFKEQGVPTISGDYTNHIYHWAGYDTDQGMKAFASKLWWQKDKTAPDILTFLSREPGAKDWFPLAYQSADAYLGAASRKLSFNDWYKKWSPAIEQWKTNNQFGNTAKWLEGFLSRNMTPGEADIGDKIVNGLVNFEYFHYLLGNFSPAMLHLFKVIQVPTWHGFGASAKGLGEYAQAVAGKAVGGAPNAAQRAVEYYIMSPQLIQSLEQSPAWAGTFQSSFWQKLRGNPVLNPTRLTEHFDRGVNVLSSIAAGGQKGVSAQVIHDATMDAMTRLNFFGWDAPPIIAKHRVVGMFQMQPWKLAEVKWQMIRGAIMGEKDYYGQSHWPKLARLAVTLGGLYEGGELLGLGLAKHIGAHIPFFTDTMQGGTSPAVSPVIRAFAEMGPSGKGLKEFGKEWLSYGGTPQKLLQEQIPQRYDESRIQWLLGLPSSDWKEEAKARSERTELLDKKRNRRREAILSGKTTPYAVLKGLMED